MEFGETQRTAAVLASRLERLTAGRTVALEAPPELHAALAAGLREAGWQPAPETGQAAALILFRPGETALRVPEGGESGGPQVLLAIGESLGELPEVWRIRERRVFRVADTLNLRLEAMASRAEARGRGAKRRRLLDRWAASPFAASVGERILGRELPDNHVWLLVRDGSARDRSRRQRWLDRLGVGLVTAGGAGLIPYFPGTWGAFVAFLLALPLAATAGSYAAFWAVCLAAAVLSTALCVATEPWVGRHFGTADPREVVLDEVAGTFAAYLILPPDFLDRHFASQAGLLFAGFAVFRFFDIFKVGVHWLERRGWRGSIVWDDVLAGIYAGCVVRLADLLLR